MGELSLDQFQAACGAREPLRLRITSADDPSVSFVKVLHHPFAIVGRHPRADLLLDHAAISRRHAYFQVIGGRVFCIDLESRTGLRWGDSPERAGWLDPSAPVAIGPFRVEVLRNEPPEHGGLPVLAALASPLADWPAERAPFPRAALEFVNRTGGPRHLPMNQCLALVGRSPLCRPRLTDEAASRFQCALLWTADGVWIVDLLGREGVQVGRALVRFARLDHGDELRLGRYEFRLHYDPPPSPGPVAQLPVERPQAGVLLGPAGSATTAASALSGSWGALAPLEAADPRLAPLIEQFGQMQQQMFEQFQQSMMMMFQMFNTLHRDQMKVVQDELEHIRRLSQQLSTIQAQAALAGAPTERGHDRAHSGTGGQERDGARAGKWSMAAPPGPGRVPPVEPRSGAHVLPTGCDEPPLDAQPSPSAVPNGPHAPITHAGDDIHTLLCQRIAQIQNERQTRWQRILNVVTGQ